MTPAPLFCFCLFVCLFPLFALWWWWCDGGCGGGVGGCLTSQPNTNVSQVSARMAVLAARLR